MSGFRVGWGAGIWVLRVCGIRAPERGVSLEDLHLCLPVTAWQLVCCAHTVAGGVYVVFDGVPESLHCREARVPCVLECIRQCAAVQFTALVS